MANIVVPFDFNPDSTTVRTGTYTIPAGKYALVKPLGPQLQDLEIDSVVAFQQNLVDTSTTLSNASGTETVGTTPVNGRWICELWLFETTTPSGWSFTNVNVQNTNLGIANGKNESITTTFTTDGHFARFEMSGAQLVRLQQTGPTPTGTMTARFVAQKRDSPTEGDFWVPTGTQIDGTRYVVTEYNVVS